MLEKRKSLSFSSEMDTDSDNHDTSELVEERPQENSDQVHLVQDQEKRMRREIANSNERRRMQTINAGFVSLKALIPIPDGDKTSKAAVLQQAVEYINNIQAERTTLHQQVEHQKKVIQELMSRKSAPDTCGAEESSPPLKRKKTATESSDEGISGMSPGKQQQQVAAYHLAQQQCEAERLAALKEVQELRHLLDHEQRIRCLVEDQVVALRTALAFPALQSFRIETERLMLESKRAVEKELLAKAAPAAAVPFPSPPVIASPLLSSPLPTLAPPQPPPASVSPASPESPKPRDTNANVSQRNLNTIVEAIRVLEGEEVFKPSTPVAVKSDCVTVNPANRERYTSVSSLSETASSLHLSVPHLRLSYPPPPPPISVSISSVPSALGVVSSPAVSTDLKYPIAMHLLHGPLGLPDSMVI